MNKRRFLWPIIFAGLFFSFTVFARSVPLDKVIAVVNNDVITENQLHTQVIQARARLEQQHRSVPDSSILQRQVLNQMINERLQLQIAKNLGLKVSEKEVSEAIIRIAHNNKISVTKLQSAIAAEGTSFSDYKKMIHKQLLIRKVQMNKIRNQLQIDPKEVKQLANTLAERSHAIPEYHVYNILIRTPEVPSSSELMAAKRKALSIVSQLRKGANFKKLATQYSAAGNALNGGDLGWRKAASLPSIFSKSIKRMKVGNISEPIRAANGFHILKLAAIRNDKLQHFITKYKVRQILIKPSAMLSDDVAKEKIKALRKNIQLKKTTFSKAAREHSEDLDSAGKDGLMGWVSTSNVESKFADYLKHLKKNVLSQPFRTAQGWHVIQVLARKKIENTRELLDVRARELLVKRKFMEKLQVWINTLRSNAYIQTFEK